jgi:hypothetical protein
LSTAAFQSPISTVPPQSTKAFSFQAHAAVVCAVAATGAVIALAFIAALI